MRTKLTMNIMAAILAVAGVNTTACEDLTPSPAPIWEQGGDYDACGASGTWMTDPLPVMYGSGGDYYTTEGMRLVLTILGNVPGSWVEVPVGDDDDSAATTTEWVETGRFLGIIEFIDGCTYYDTGEGSEYECDGDELQSDLTFEGGSAYNGIFPVEGAIVATEYPDTVIAAFDDDLSVASGTFPDTSSMRWNFGDEVSPLGRFVLASYVEWGYVEFTYTYYMTVANMNQFGDIQGGVNINTADSYTFGDVYDVCQAP